MNEMAKWELVKWDASKLLGMGMFERAWRVGGIVWHGFG